MDIKDYLNNQMEQNREKRSDIDIESNLMNYKATQFANSNKSIKDIEKMGLSIHLSNRYLVNSLDTLMYIILHEVVSNSLIIKKCQICGKYFIPNKSNEIYCEFLNEENNTICRNVGAFQVYKQNLENTPALLEYRRTYNRKSNEVSRDKENVKLKEDFKEWRKGAQEKIKEFKTQLNNNNIIQVHRSYLINLDFVYDVNSKFIILRNKKEINIGKTYKKKFKLTYQDYLLNGSL